MSQTQKIAVVGLGKIGKAVATNLAHSNRQFIVADRQIEKAKEVSQALGKSAQAADIDAAVKQADIILLAIPFPAVATFFSQYSNSLSGKIIIDPSNPIVPDEKGGFKKVIGLNESAGQINAAALPSGARLVKAFGTLGVASLGSAAFQRPDKAVLFYAADDDSVDAEIDKFIRENGFEPVKIGGLDQSIRIEVFGDLHEFGALGKTVTLAGAKQVA